MLPVNMGPADRLFRSVVVAPALPRVSNCLNTVNNTMAMTSHTANFENH